MPRYSIYIAEITLIQLLCTSICRTNNSNFLFLIKFIYFKTYDTLNINLVKIWCLVNPSFMCDNVSIFILFINILWHLDKAGVLVSPFTYKSCKLFLLLVTCITDWQTNMQELFSVYEEVVLNQVRHHPKISYYTIIDVIV